MHIKTVIVEGFKTYKTRTEVSFDKAHNVILGKNGMGKSNIFDAIAFVLSDKYENLRQEDRKQLLHEGRGQEVMAATVEVIFDNEDQRIPVDKKEVSVRRSIGAKKDLYFLDGKQVGKAEIVTLLESAGLSRSNPYYIVQQGRVRALINMKDEERLDLFKEIAGTRTYDDRRKESQKIMKDTDGRRAQIQEVIDSIESRLGELESEKEELKKYLEYDRDKRAIEYTVYNQELQLSTDKLDRLENDRVSTAKENSDAHNRAAEARKQLADAGEEQSKLEVDRAKLERDHAKKESERKTLIAEKSKLELELKEEENKAASDEKDRSRANTELGELKTKIEKAKTDLAKVVRTYEAKQKDEEKLKIELNDSETRLNQLFAKQARAGQYRTKRERDAALKSQITDAEKQLKAETKKLKELKEREEETKRNMAEGKEVIAKKQAEMEAFEAKLKSLGEETEALKKARDDALNDRKTAQRLDSELDMKLTDANAMFDKADGLMRMAVDKNMMNGMQMVEVIVKEKKLQNHVYGRIIDLFKTTPTYYKCVETTGGSQLFNYVVDTDDTAAKILTELNKRNAGRVTFMPLNRLKPNDRELPPSSADAIVMIDRLEFDEKHRKAFQQIFGKTLICRDMDTASSVSKKHNIDTITLEGDQVSKRGALTGGFIDSKRSKLKTADELKVARATLQAIEVERKKSKENVMKHDQAVTKAQSDMTRNREAKGNTREGYAAAEADKDRTERELKALGDTIKVNEKLIRDTEAKIDKLTKQVALWREEQATELTDTLSGEEKAELKDLNARVDEMKKTIVAASAARSKAEQERDKLQNTLDSHLLPRESQLRKVIRLPEEASEAVIVDRHELDTAIGAIADCLKSLQALDEKLKANATRSATLGKDIETFKKQEGKYEEMLSRESKSMEKLMNKRTVLLSKKDDCTRKIRDLGTLPPNLDRYHDWDTDKLMAKLKKIHEHLAKYKHINKKALDQWNSFSEQRDSLTKRKVELDESRKSITELIDTLDQKKDEAIQRTFKGIAKHFNSVFKELAPSGKGQLVIRKAADEDEEEEDEEEELKGDESGEEETKSEKKTRGKKSAAAKKKDAAKKGKKDSSDTLIGYTGVGIKVSFSKTKEKKDDGSTPVEGTHLMQLSGGQQAIVALALIFAIQRLDPSPFYLFDEIDAALDGVHRTNVAKMIHAQAHEDDHPSQFITTTFSAEQINHGDKFFAVNMKNESSDVRPINQEEAKKLLIACEQEAERAEQGGGERARPFDQLRDASPRDIGLGLGGSQGGSQSRDRSASRDRSESVEREVKSGRRGGAASTISEQSDAEESEADNSDEEEKKGGKKKAGGKAKGKKVAASKTKAKGKAKASPKAKKGKKGKKATASDEEEEEKEGSGDDEEDEEEEATAMDEQEDKSDGEEASSSRRSTRKKAKAT